MIGQAIRLDAQPYTVIGVMPPEFEFPTAAAVEAWAPLAFDPKDLHGRSRQARSLTVVGRLADGVTSAGAQDEIGVLAQRIATAYQDTNKGWSARVVAAHEQLVGASRPALLVLMGAVGFLLLIVCANMPVPVDVHSRSGSPNSRLPTAASRQVLPLRPAGVAVEFGSLR